MDIRDLKSGQLVADGRTLLKISTVFDHEATATVVYPVPPRTIVHRFSPSEVARFTEPGRNLIGQYEVAYRLPRSEV